MYSLSQVVTQIASSQGATALSPFAVGIGTALLRTIRPEATLDVSSGIAATVPATLKDLRERHYHSLKDNAATNKVRDLYAQISGAVQLSQHPLLQDVKSAFESWESSGGQIFPRSCPEPARIFQGDDEEQTMMGQFHIRHAIPSSDLRLAPGLVAYYHLVEEAIFYGGLVALFPFDGKDTVYAYTARVLKEGYGVDQVHLRSLMGDDRISVEVFFGEEMQNWNFEQLRDWSVNRDTCIRPYLAGIARYRLRQIQEERANIGSLPPHERLDRLF